MGSLAAVLGGATCTANALPSVYNPPTIGDRSKKQLIEGSNFFVLGEKTFYC